LVEKDHSKFKIFSENRPVTYAHVMKICDNESFPLKYMLNPIIVNENMYVIDGQHRLQALTMLNLPVYYVIQEGGDCMSIINYQTSKKWTVEDFIRFYARRGLRDFNYLLEYRERYEISLFTAATLVRCFCEVKGKSKSSIFREGILDITHKDKLEDFSYLYIPVVKKIQTDMKPKKIPQPFHESYIRAAVEIYYQDRARLKILMDKLPNYCTSIPNTSKENEARENFEIIIARRAR
jgi:hypothetical protein